MEKRFLLDVYVAKRYTDPVAKYGGTHVGRWALGDTRQAGSPSTNYSWFTAGIPNHRVRAVEVPVDDALRLRWRSPRNRASSTEVIHCVFSSEVNACMRASTDC